MKNNILNINGNPFLQRSAEDELDFWKKYIINLSIMTN